MRFLKSSSRPVSHSGLLFLLGIFVCWLTPAYCAEEKAKPAPSQASIPCHPPFGDLSPDGKAFVHVDQNFARLNVLETDENKNLQVKLPKKAYDVVALDHSRAVVSYGPWGELAVVDLKQGAVKNPFKVGGSAEGMCKTSDGRVLVTDTEAKKIQLVDPTSQSILKSFPLQSEPAQMRWLVPDLQMEVADVQGKIIAVIKLPQPTETKPR